MPEGYTHVRTARRAAALAQLEIEHPAAFACGANGPDIFFCYRAWKSGEKRGEDLPALGERMHHENTGAFLRALVQNAATPVQRSYALGFLSHYAADCTVHPYVVCVTGEGGPYAGPGGHGYFEIAVDSHLHELDTGKLAVPVDDTTPLLAGADLAEVGALLQKSLRQAYGLTVSREALADTFWHTRALRRLFVSRFHIKYALFWLVEPAFGGRGAVTGHITPARLAGTGSHPKGSLPCPWVDPFTGQRRMEDLNALLTKADKAGRIHFVGNVEAREAVYGQVDVIVSDGYSGNIFLKTMEGTGGYMAKQLKAMFTKNIFTKLAAVLVADGIRSLKKSMDAGEVGGTALLGISRPVIKAHGSSDDFAIKNAIRQAQTFAASGIIDDITENIDHMKLPSDKVEKI